MNWNIFTNDEKLHAVIDTPDNDLAAISIKDDFADGTSFIIADDDRKYVTAYTVKYEVQTHGDIRVIATRIDTGQEI